MNQQNLEEIKKITKDFFQKTTFEVEIDFLPPQGLTLPINLKTDDPQILIGEKGQTLIELQYLLKIILKRKISESFFVDLDINGYKKKKNEYLKELAKSAADEAALTKKEKSLAPMPAYERRIIHLELADRQDVTTESIGQEPERKVIIKPYP
jgi:spoIIIJ-associated protein